VRRATVIAVAGSLLVPATSLGAGSSVQVRIDDLQATIRDQRSQIETTETRTKRSIAMPSDVLFAFDSAQLSRAGARAVRAVAADLEGDVRVTGHTDARGSGAYNRRLSVRRASAVARALRAAAPSLALRVSSAGEAHPIASNRTEQGRARNRRVEIEAHR
jgi:outer membrane protein OmpA-like peptidoglycan-associated protein